MKRRGLKRGLWWCLGVGIVLALLGIAIVRIEKPPVKEIEDARNILSEAEKWDAEVYSRTLYREAKAMYDSAMNNWKTENERFILFRRYEKTRLGAENAKVKGRKAIERAKIVRQNTKEELRTDIDRLRQEMRGFEQIFAVLPLRKEIKDKHAQGKLLLNAAEIAFEKADYKVGGDKSGKASVLIRESYRDARNVLEKYFDRLSVWQKEKEEAIQISRKKKDYVVVIEKIPPRCIVYSDGVEKYSFPVEFGRNWMGDKQREGDYATPEGSYRVVKKMQGRATQYYKALLLDYPNRHDRVEFEKRKKKGIIGKRVNIGGLIEIHGGGGRGANWTNGCAALDNKDMDQLYKRIDKGVIVTIIGASQPLDEALKNF